MRNSNIESSIGKYVIPIQNMHILIIAKEAKVVQLYSKADVIVGEGVELRVAA